MMMTFRRFLALGAALFSFALSDAQAAVVANSLPYMGTPDWTDVHGLGASIDPGRRSLDPDGRRLDHAGLFRLCECDGQYAGMGAQQLCDRQHAHAHGQVRRAAGRPAATDWTAEIYDSMTRATMVFNPKTCAGVPCAPGVQITFGNAATPSIASQMFIPIDTSVYQDYAILLLNGSVWYQAGNQVFSGTACSTPLPSRGPSGSAI